MRLLLAVLLFAFFIVLHGSYRLVRVDWCYAQIVWYECNQVKRELYGEMEEDNCPAYWRQFHQVEKWEEKLVWIVGVAVYALVVLRLLKTMRRVRACSLRLSECYKRISGTLRWLLHSKRDPHVYDEYQKLRLDFVGNSISKARTVCVMYLIASSINLIRWGRTPKGIVVHFYTGSDYAFAALWSIPLLSFDLARSWWTPAALDYLNIIFSSLWIWRYFTMMPNWLLYWGGFHWLARVSHCIILGNPCLSIVLQSLVTAADVYASYRNCVRNEGAQGIHFLASYGFGNFAVLLLVGSILFSFRHAMWTTAQSLVEARDSKNANLSAHRLLAGMCDAVVSLDSDFNIVLPCPKLAGLLLRPSIGVPNFKRRFLDFMPSEDQKRFTLFLTEEAASQEASHANIAKSLPARVLHATLYDAYMSPVQVELFSSFNGASGSHGPYHLVGIIAASNNVSIIQSESPEDVIQSEALAYHTICEASISSPSDVTYSSFSSVATICDDVQQYCATDQDAAVVINTRTEGYEIVQCSSTFANLGGASSLGRTLSEWFPSSDSWTRIDSFIQNLVEHTARSGGVQTDILTDVFLVPPNLDGSIRIQCNCSATVEERDVFDDGAGHANVVFSNFTPRVGKNKPKGRKKYRTQSAAKRIDMQSVSNLREEQVRIWGMNNL